MINKNMPDQETWIETLEELKQQIPNIYPLWTDFNLHDPGMTLIELIAWMKDIQLYHMSQISDAHKRKYGKLLGLHREGPRPGRVYVTVDETSKDLIYSKKSLYIPADSRFYAEDICFESVEPQAVASGIFKGFTVEAEDDTDSLFGDWLCDGKGISLYPFGRNPKAGYKCTIHLLYPLEPGLPYKLYIDVVKPYRLAPMEEKAYDGHGFYPLGEWKLEYNIKGGWKEVTDVEDKTYSFTYPGCLSFTLSEPMGEDNPTLRFTLLRSDYLNAPCIERISLSMILAEQRETELCQVMFEANGFPRQDYDLQNKKLILQRLSIYADQREWTWVEDFDCSGPYDRHYGLDKGHIIFGDGYHGMIPEKSICAKGMSKTLGSLGNIKAGAVNYMVWENNRVVSVANEMDVWGGLDEETEEEMIVRFNREHGKGNRAVSYKDYEDLICGIPGLAIERCKAFEPEHGQNQIALAVKPYTQDGFGMLNQAYIKNIYAYLEEKRLLGTKLLVISPEYLSIHITCEIIPKVSYSNAKQMVEKTIEDFMKGRDFGQGIIYGELFGMIDALVCVRSLCSLRLNGGSRGKRNTRGDLLIPFHGLLKLEQASCILLSD